MNNLETGDGDYMFAALKWKQEIDAGGSFAGSTPTIIAGRSYKALLNRAVLAKMVLEFEPAWAKRDDFIVWHNLDVESIPDTASKATAMGQILIPRHPKAQEAA